MDILIMPTSDRRYELHLLMNENAAKQEHYDKVSKGSGSGARGSRTTTISGDALKAKMKSGEINI